jgi:hypothetical protein
MLMGCLALVVFFGSVLLPIALAVICWRRARSSRRGWLFHLLFLPSVIVSEWAIIEFLGFTAGDNGDGPSGEGFLYAPAIITLFMSVFAYYACLVTVVLFRQFRTRSHVR